MDDTLTKFLAQLPVAAIIVFVVKMFLTHLKEDRTSRTAERTEEREMLKILHKDHMLAREESRLAINECSRSNRELVDAIRQWRDALPR